MARVADELPEGPRVKVLDRFFDEFQTMGRLVVVDSLAQLIDRRKGDRLLAKALKSDDAAVVGTAANVAVTLRPAGIEETLMKAYRRLYAQREFEAVQSVFDALGRLEYVGAKEILDRHTDDNHPGIKFAATDAIRLIEAAEERVLRERNSSLGHLPQRAGFAPPPAEQRAGDSSDLRIVRLPQFRGGTLYTNRGEIEVEFFGREAPQTVKNFTQLAGRKFYDGLSFHRVVPDFVVQGGDPRGDGWGGPGYTIPCEINGRPFEAGTLGMALSGQDTGGSQFFITHSPQPHLDGQYTAFGRVVKGQEVVDSLGEGDRILKVKLHRVN
jgi:cyclophilin family peptidyl-prolyl cis-trans isomerase